MSYDDPDDSQGSPSVIHLEPANIPDFEGKTVAQTKAKITSTTGLEVNDQVWSLDEFVRMEIEGKVVAIDHKVDEKSGLLYRVHTIKAIDTRVLSWGDED